MLQNIIDTQTQVDSVGLVDGGWAPMWKCESFAAIKFAFTCEKSEKLLMEIKSRWAHAKVHSLIDLFDFVSLNAKIVG